MTTYVLGGGCFWCIDAVFRRLRGVKKVETGYAGGTTDKPSYYQVASGSTGHAEVVRVTFDEAVIPTDIILAIYFLIHNPTTPDRQGADVGPQYRSIMLYNGNTQQHEFKMAIRHAEPVWNAPIVTELQPLAKFYVAEKEHQDYFDKNPTAGYCTVVIAPKIIKARQKYSQWFKEN